MTGASHLKLAKPEKVLLLAGACLLLLGVAYKYYDDARPSLEPRPFISGSEDELLCYNRNGSLAQVGDLLMFPRYSVKLQTSNGLARCKKILELAELEHDLHLRCSKDIGNQKNEECAAYRAHYLNLERERVRETTIQAWKDFKKDLRDTNRDILSFISNYTVFILIVSALGGYWWMKRQRR